MAEKEGRHSQDQGRDSDQETSNNIGTAGSEKNREPSISDSSSTAGSIHAVSPVKGEKSSSSHPDGVTGSPDIGHDAVEHAVPGHDLDVELALVCHPSWWHHSAA